MKNVVIFDDCQDYFYDIHSVSAEDFQYIFPGSDQNVEFHDDLYNRPQSRDMEAAFKRMWYNRRNNKKVNGLHGMLFYENFDRKPFYANKHDFADARATCFAPLSQRGKTIMVVSREPSEPIIACYVDCQLFESLFHLPQQDTLFYEDVEQKYGDEKAKKILSDIKINVLSKPDVPGIDGTLYIGYPEKRMYFVNRIDADIPRHYPRQD